MRAECRAAEHLSAWGSAKRLRGNVEEDLREISHRGERPRGPRGVLEASERLLRDIRETSERHPRGIERFPRGSRGRRQGNVHEGPRDGCRERRRPSRLLDI